MRTYSFFRNLFSFTGFLAVALMVNGAVAQEDDASKEATQNVLTLSYEKQAFVECMGKQFKIPPYFPHVTTEDSSGLHLTVEKSKCNDEVFEVHLGLIEGCLSQNLCKYAGFSRYKAPSGLISKLHAMLAVSAEEVELGNGNVAFYVPATCDAYCNYSFLFWPENGYINIIGTANSTIGEKTRDRLVRSANSYIENLGE